MDTKEWKKTREGRMAIYYLATDIADNIRKQSTVSYICNINNITEYWEDGDKTIDFLRTLIISEWIGD